MSPKRKDLRIARAKFGNGPAPFPIIIIIYEFHGDTSLETKLHGHITQPSEYRRIACTSQK